MGLSVKCTNDLAVTYADLSLKAVTARVTDGFLVSR